VFRFAQRGVRSQVVSPHAKAGGIDIVASGQRVHGGAQLVGFFVAEGRDACAGAVAGEIEYKNVVLVVLQRGNQREQFAATGFVPVAKDYRGCSA
jgi:hypothetical protein